MYNQTMLEYFPFKKMPFPRSSQQTEHCLCPLSNASSNTHNSSVLFDQAFVIINTHISSVLFDKAFNVIISPRGKSKTFL